MALNLRPPTRRVGQTRQSLPYGHLLTSLPKKEDKPNTEAQKNQVRKEPAWDAPPIGSSDEDSSVSNKTGSLPKGSRCSSTDSEMRSRPVGFRIPTLTAGKSGSKEKEKNPTNSRSSQGLSKASRSPLQRKRSNEEMRDDEDTLFNLNYRAPKPRIEYRKSRNIHATHPSPPKKQKTQDKKEQAAVLKRAKNGFKSYDMNGIDAKAKPVPKFKVPGQIPSSAKPIPRKGTRRSTRHLHTEEQAEDQFHLPPGIPPVQPERDNSKNEPTFISPPRGLSTTGPTTSFHLPPQLTHLSTPHPNPAPLISSSLPSLTTDTADSSSLSSAPTSPTLSSTHYLPTSPPPQTTSSPPTPATCPICTHPVDRTHLQSFTLTHATAKHKSRLTVRQQEAFCRSHKRLTALETWNNRGYPVLEWERFGERLRGYGEFLQEVMFGRRESWWRERVGERVWGRGKRTAVQRFVGGGEDGGGEVGYYGGRGARVMMDHIIAHFAPALRTLAATDKLIASSGGVSGFVQGVLVPELATRLVMDDMGVNEEQAREILKESAEVGALLCEEEDEVVERRNDEEGVGYGEE